MTLLMCRIEPGPMSHEFAIVVRGTDRDYESWADSRDVRFLHDRTQPPGEGLVPVRLIDEDADGQRALVELPAEVIMGSRRVWVPLSQVRR